MENVKINAKIVTIGFRPSEIRPRKMWTVLQDEFLELYNDYAELTNDRIPILNGAWKTWYPEKEEDESEDKEELTPEEQENKDLKDEVQKWKYGCYMRDAFDMCAFMANQKHPDSYLSGFVFMEGNQPIFGARIKQHPELSMAFEIESK